MRIKEIDPHMVELTLQSNGVKILFFEGEPVAARFPRVVWHGETTGVFFRVDVYSAYLYLCINSWLKLYGADLNTVKFKSREYFDTLYDDPVEDYPIEIRY